MKVKYDFKGKEKEEGYSVGADGDDAADEGGGVDDAEGEAGAVDVLGAEEEKDGRRNIRRHLNYYIND
jgi:hypothetical protein